MKLMKNLSMGLLSLSGISLFSLNGQEAVCHRCEEIREYNAENHQNFDYYDDYLKANNGARNSKAPNGSASHQAVAERGPVNPAIWTNDANQPKHSSALKSIPSSTSSLPSTGDSGPLVPPATQAPQNGSNPRNGPSSTIPRAL